LQWQLFMIQGNQNVSVHLMITLQLSGAQRLLITLYNQWQVSWALAITQKKAITYRIVKKHTRKCTNTLTVNLTFRGPCIMLYSYNESQWDALFLRFVW
jgi:hypothetical protein